ncbi:MAG: carboxylating nicotinate-nucleotide diphosphorylase [Methylocystis sp.]|jgi:nicotinate-nucleotide pyrophosphorylase (carboxylating)
MLPHLLFEKSVKEALLEDLGRAGDITSEAIFNKNIKIEATLVARKCGVLCGTATALTAFQLIDPEIKYDNILIDTALVNSGDIIARINGSATSILAAERVALNFLGHLSGISTLTAEYVSQISHTHAKICDTRKTTPNLRALEKYAVSCGGGVNHRFGLDDAILIKDNHIAVAGGVAAALRAAKQKIGHLVKIEIEVDTLDQLHEALSEGVDVVLLDNMSIPQLAEAVRMINKQALSEASGGISLDTVAAVAETGVNLISVGALTHSAPVLDVGLDIHI